ncbi:MAG: ECF transporter S component, partial [Prevotella melaninogenica]
MIPASFQTTRSFLCNGCWYAPLAMYFVPTKGAGTIGELLAATVEMAIGGQWGALTIFEG